MGSKVQISLDDTKGCFKFLAARPDAASIFETRVLGFLKELHEKYGTEFTLFCIYRSGDFTLDQVSDRYQTEFLANKDWLHFGFHAYEENSDYSGVGAEKMQRDYQATMNQVRRITGAECFSHTIRLHRFAGSREACRALREQGVRCLLTADDERKSYYLGDRECEMLKQYGSYTDQTEGIQFVCSLPRLEYCSDPVVGMQNAENQGYPLISVFTHEWQMDRGEVRERLLECCIWEQKHRVEEGKDAVGHEPDNSN